MRVLSHRGYWLDIQEKNQLSALRRTFAFNFGTETDVRDLNGQLVISHDPAVSGAIAFSDFLTLARSHSASLPLALNIKSDGLARAIREEITRHGIKDWFVFDMSVPDMRGHLKEGNPVFTRMSEVERNPVWLEQATGVWLDAFEEHWYEPAQLTELLLMGKQICLVSAELHGRPHLPQWEWIKHHELHRQKLMMICTDHPEDARRFFGEEA
jgi:glycerophosphoryl diester phosphodiesterase